MEAVIIPITNHIFEYTGEYNGNSLKVNVKGTIELLYLRFEPVKVAELFQYKIYHLQSFTSLTEIELRELYTQLLQIRDSFLLVNSGFRTLVQSDSGKLCLTVPKKC
jgi:hypothetical protein